MWVRLQLIESLIDRVDLSEEVAEASLDLLLGEANEALISAFLVLLRAKGETFEEVDEFGSYIPPPAPPPPRLSTMLFKRLSEPADRGIGQGDDQALPEGGRPRRRRR